MKNQSFLAFDIGATSGRSILGTLDNGRLQMKEITRFPNQMLQIGDHFHWNIYALFEHLKAGLVAAKNEGVEITSIGIDTWGVDFALLAEDGSILGAPFAHRDPHTVGVPEKYFEMIPREKVYELTGIQVMNINSLYQLFALSQAGNSLLKATKEILFMPDALAYLLTGNKVVEYTIASTSQILNPRTKKFEAELLEKAGVSPSILGEIVMPGHLIGTLRDDLAEESELGKVKVLAVAGHDTGSAVAAVPAVNENFAYLSSGTWSLIGIEVKAPIINEETFVLNFTNEGGIEGTTRFQKNNTGMWLLEQCLKEWKKEGITYAYEELVSMANTVTAFQSLIDPDHTSFTNPVSMTKSIKEYCLITGQTAPESHAEFVRCIFESLSLKYHYELCKLKRLAPFPIEKLHVIGGGSKNPLLNQWTSNATGIPVVAGPSEATAIGNVMIQAKAAGCVGSLQEMRKIIRESVQLDEFLPENPEMWAEAYNKFLSVTKLQKIPTTITKVNAHLHTPYSFSAFTELNQVLDMAVTEGVKVLGINDFYTTAGYETWAVGCKARGLYPLFNIEFICLNETDQKAGLRVNDPGNPGRTYLSGKGLSYPFELDEPFATQLADVVTEANAQVKAICDKMNEILAANHVGFTLDFEWIKNNLTEGLIRERHLAKALRLKVFEACGNDEARIKYLFWKLFAGKDLKSTITDFAGIENEIRSNLLKTGGGAFVPEDPKAFLPIQTVYDMIVAGGGIPTYPFLADDTKGGYTDFESDLESVAQKLTERGFHSVEFITTRNDVELLEKYANYLHNQGFVVTFGSEHNTPAMEPIELFARNSAPLTDNLMKINYEGACVIAAHQHLSTQGKKGYVDANGNSDRSKRAEFIKLGDELIQKISKKRET
jgi:rhamnulokinase